jgi:glycine cleavage system H protein
VAWVNSFAVANVPPDLKYTKSHEWVRLDGDLATMGITDFAQSELGDIVYVDLPTPGRMVKAGDTLGSVESVKTVSDIYAPLSGEVVEVNPSLGSQSELVNSDPYGQGWMVKIRASEPSASEGLMEPDAYKGSLS